VMCWQVLAKFLVRFQNFAFLGNFLSKNWLRIIDALIAGIEKNFSQGGGSGEGRHPVYLTLQLSENTKNVLF